MQPERVAFLSPRYEQILEAHPSWAVYFSLAKETILIADDGNAYRLVLTEGDGEEKLDPVTPTLNPIRPDTSPSPTPSPSHGPTLDRPMRDLCTAPFLLLVPVAAIALKRSFG
jgi:hypothetical protein